MRYTVEIEQPDGRRFTQEHVERVETEWGLNGEKILITFNAVGPVHYDLMDGTVVRFTEEGVND